MLVGLTWGFAGLGEGVASDDSASILMKIKYNIMFQNFTQLIIKRKKFWFWMQSLYYWFRIYSVLMI